MLYTTLRIIFAVIFQLLFRAKTYGKENLPAEGPVILAANHMSNWDPPLLATFLPRPVSYMAKIELFEHPIFGAAIRRCHAFPVKRGAADRGAIKAAVNVLRQAACSASSQRARAARTGNSTRPRPASACSPR